MGNVSLKVLEKSLNFLFKNGTNPVKGSRNPNLQFVVVITHASHVCSHYLVWTSAKNE